MKSTSNNFLYHWRNGKSKTRNCQVHAAQVRKWNNWTVFTRLSSPVFRQWTAINLKYSRHLRFYDDRNKTMTLMAMHTCNCLGYQWIAFLAPNETIFTISKFFQKFVFSIQWKMWRVAAVNHRVNCCEQRTTQYSHRLPNFCRFAYIYL